MEDADLDKWRRGVELEDGKTLPADVDLLRHEGDKTWLELTIREGRNQQIRRMGEATGFPVMRLARDIVRGHHVGRARAGTMALSHAAKSSSMLKKTYGVPKRIPHDLARRRRRRRNDDAARGGEARRSERRARRAANERRALRIRRDRRVAPRTRRKTTAAASGADARTCRCARRARNTRHDREKSITVSTASRRTPFSARAVAPARAGLRSTSGATSRS